MHHLVGLRSQKGLLMIHLMTWATHLWHKERFPPNHERSYFLVPCKVHRDLVLSNIKITCKKDWTNRLDWPSAKSSRLKHQWSNGKTFMTIEMNVAQHLNTLCRLGSVLTYPSGNIYILWKNVCVNTRLHILSYIPSLAFFFIRLWSKPLQLARYRSDHSFQSGVSPVSTPPSLVATMVYSCLVGL